MSLEEETNNSFWKSKFDTFEVSSHWNKVVNSDKPNLKLNEYRLVEINATLFIETSTQTREITFLTDLKHFEYTKNHTWHACKPKGSNIYYIQTEIKKDNIRKKIQFHRLIYPEWYMIDHINRSGLDNRECNLRETTPRENQLNRKLQTNNTLDFNRISFHKKSKF